MKNPLLLLKKYLSFLNHPPALGNRIRIEASSICQLNCPLCSQHGENKTNREIIGSGYLKFSDFKQFVDTYPNFRNIELSNYGEIFLNPELSDIIHYAYKKNIALTAANGVNLNKIDEAIVEDMVKYRFKALNISIDGATDDTYRIYRKNGDFHNVIKNIEIINYHKRKYNSKFPLLTWQFIAFSHNEAEIRLAKEMSKSLNMNFHLKLNWDSSRFQVTNVELVRKFAGFASRQEFEQITKRLYYPICEQLWTSPQINWDGKLLGCCVNKWIHFGNVFRSGLEECIKDEKYLNAKEAILGKKKATKDIPCFYCPLYEKLEKFAYFRDYFRKRYSVRQKNDVS
jgi:sulfatase maturation enzyme AslB (radical SAM superfamily)